MVLRSLDGTARARSASGSPPAAPMRASPSPPAASASPSPLGDGDGEYSRWLRAMPKVPKSSNVAQDETNVVVRATLMKLVHHLQGNPNEVFVDLDKAQHSRGTSGTF